MTMDLEVGRMRSEPGFAEACRRTGILEEELEEAERGSREGGLDEDVLKLRREHFERKRLEKLRLVAEMMEKLAQEEDMKRRAKALESRINRNAKADLPTDLVAKEQAQLERIKDRQRQEMEQMLAFELRQAKQEQENKARLEREAEVKREREAQIRARMAQEEARRVEKENAKVRAEKQQQQQRRRLMEREAKAAKRQAQLDRARELQMAIESRKREMEREAKLQQSRAETKKLLDAQQEVLLAKQREMERRDAERRKALEESKRRMAEEHAEKQKRQRERIERAKQNQESLLEHKRREFLTRQQQAEERQRKFEEQTELSRQEAIARANEKASEIQRTREQMVQRAKEKRSRAEQREAEINHRLLQRELQAELFNRQKSLESKERDAARRQTYEQMVQHQKAKCASIFRKRQEKEQAAARRAAAQRKTDALKAEKLRLREQDRLELIERKRRMDEYNRKLILSKIAEENARVEKIRKARAELLRQRDEHKKVALKKRQDALHAFDLMRTTGKLKLPKGMDLTVSTTSTARLPDLSTKPQSQSARKCSPDVRASTRPKSAHHVRHAASRKACVEKNSNSEHSIFGQSESEDESKHAMSTAEPQKTGSPSSSSETQPTRPRSSAGRACGSVGTLSPRLGKQKKKTKMKRPSTAKPRSNTSKGKKHTVEQMRAEIEKLKREQNEHLLSVLEKEQNRERKRESMLRRVRNSKERKRLNNRFGLERAKASERIMKITEENERIMGDKMNLLNRRLANLQAN